MSSECELLANSVLFLVTLLQHVVQGRCVNVYNAFKSSYIQVVLFDKRIPVAKSISNNNYSSVPLSILPHLSICTPPNTPSPYHLYLSQYSLTSPTQTLCSFLLPACFYLICRNVWFNTVLRCSQLTSIVPFYSPKTTTNIVQN